MIQLFSLLPKSFREVGRRFHPLLMGRDFLEFAREFSCLEGGSQFELTKDFCESIT
jgi:hypothetical protein